ncbi:NADH-quinone oxidoreductase subunit J [Rubeoparvulum massiliense]|uniref:NADH-quinone oxidoreductase subunit J n=1 Tax=Rubeoparvulum massiliense TaxID=1631346 RepID=UPI00065E1709|nr:NADH-quinone oxidoreductase subunit J [Rubeoparvulum massiliense]
MSGEFIAFIILALMAITGATLMVTFTKVVHMVIAMTFTFLSIAGLYFVLEAEFIGVVQILLYTGAITIVMLFGIMLTKHDAEDAQQSHRGWKFFIFLLVVAFGALMLSAIFQVDWPNAPVHYSGEDNTKAIGKQLFTNYVIPFELLSVLLLVAMVGAIILSKREKEDEK